MFLKRIDLIGFKSFADKTSIEFSPGVTAVVGPNGSGKSNIADAIRWVLGEQSARTLRGSKMEDVIFAGSESRRAINFCEVSLTLDNTDRHLPVVYDEVTITRRVYRSGESEYLINRQPCRLKDITELFMDSGLGRESYSIVGQGRIEEMLSTRPEERRGPFEDAAGIVKFKHRRKEAERKLEDTEANLVRVDDLIAELERQAEPLQREAEQAREWKTLDDERRRLEVALLVREIEDLKMELSRAQTNAEELAQARDEAVRLLNNREAEWRDARAVLEGQQQALDEVQRRLVAAVEERERCEGQRALLEERIAHAQATHADRMTQHEKAMAEHERLERAFVEAERQHAEWSAKAQRKAHEAEAAASQWHPDRRAALEGEVEALSAAVIEAHQRVSACRNELATAQRAGEQGGQREARLIEEQRRWQAVLDEVREKLADAAAQAAQWQRQAEAAAALAAEKAATVQTLGEQEAALGARIDDIRRELSSLASRLELLRELNEGYDGYQQGVRAVLVAAGKGQLTGIHGALATLLEVPREYEIAIETALGAALQHIVVDTEADARAAIDLLKQRRAGRASFMPLAVVRSRRLSAAELEKARSTPGWVGVASDLVRFDERFRAAVEHVLGNVVIAERLQDANAIARRLDYRVRIVTLEGDVVNPGGVMSGGYHARKGPGLLGRQREQRDVEAAIAARQAELRTLQSERDAVRAAIDRATEAVRAAQSERDRLEQELAALAGQEREWRAQQRHAEERLSAVEWELGQLTAEREQALCRAQEAAARLAEAEAEVARLEQALADRRAELQAWDRAMQEAQAAWTALRVEAATLAQQAESARQRLLELADRRKALWEQAQAWLAEASRLAESVEQSREELAAVRDRLRELENVVAELEQRQQALRAARLEAETAAAAAEERLNAQREAAATAEDRLRRARGAADRVDLELQHALRRLGERYHMTYEWAKAQHPPVEDVNTARREAQALEERMQALGPVRLGAIDEWERLKERLSFLQRERADLEEAKARLDEVIRDIDEEMARRFRRTFEQIRCEFQEMFRVLFGGGRADLELTDEADPLHAGIEVMAQPPGKKLQNLNLLSGGERALTAMALLFAILKVRPVPFCVLDEVEAALDEANVGRFAQQLRRFAQDTQFIVITHRRGTMEEADALYGVTMQESGVSTLISVRLEDVEHEFESA